jgi:hypothetical protein
VYDGESLIFSMREWAIASLLEFYRECVKWQVIERMTNGWVVRRRWIYDRLVWV